MEELQLINHWINSGEIAFLSKNNIDVSYFIIHKQIIAWIQQFVHKYSKLPTHQAILENFDEDYKIYKELDPIAFLFDALKETKAYMKLRTILTDGAKLLNEEQTMDAINKMHREMGSILKEYSPTMAEHNWVTDALDRYDWYMEKHGKEGMSGLPTGIGNLDEYTGGWRDDDFILITGRTNEGKSLVGEYFAYCVWKFLQRTEVKRPVAYFSTEMPVEEVSYRLDTIRQHFSNRALNEGKLGNPDDYKEYLEELATKETGFIIMTQEAVGGRQFLPSDIENVIETENPALIIIDQLYDIADPSGERDIRKKIVNVTRSIRELNLKAKIPMIIIAQAGRNAAIAGRKKPDATPELEDIQESDYPAQKATRVLTIRLINSGDTFKMSLKKNRGGKKDVNIFMRADIDSGVWTETDESAVHF